MKHFYYLFAATLLMASASYAQPADGSAWAGDGNGIVEVANPVQAPCPDAGDPGCDEFDGNTVWHDQNVNGAYYVSAGGGEGELARLARYIEAAAPNEFEMRFTDEGSLGVYPSGFALSDMIISLPFEIWNIRETPDDPSDDIRMIPFINPNDAELTDWADQFTGEDTWPDGSAAPITDWVYWMMPDRPNGYELFEAAAKGFGGPGAIYDATADGDAQIDPDPANEGLDCPNQGYYVSFCYRNQEFANNGGPGTFVYPIGRFVIADPNFNEETPPTGTIIRLNTEGGTPEPIANEDSGNPASRQITAAYPNPFSRATQFDLTLEKAQHVSVRVYNVLGQEVATLFDGVMAADASRSFVLDGADLPAGVYLYRVVGETFASTRQVTLVR